MHLRRSVLAASGLAALALALSAAAAGCLLDSSGFLSGAGTTTGSGGSAGAGNGLGGDADSSGAGGTAAASTGGGGTAGSGGSAGSGGTGGSGPVDGDACPGVMISLDVYDKVLVSGNSTKAKADYGTTVCGGGSAPDVVYAVNAKSSGFLVANLHSDLPYLGFVYVRSDCEKDPALACSDVSFRVPVEKDKTYYVIVDGHDPQPAGTFKLDLFLDGCGNGIIDSDGPDLEECDDSNALDNDTCSKCKVRCTKDGAVTTDSDLFLDPVTHHCYLQSYPNVTWEQARLNCLTWGGMLAGLSTQAEIDKLGGLLAKNIEDVWIGGTDEGDEGTFHWVNGETWLYRDGMPPWNGAGEPSNSNGGENCVEIYKTKQINDDNCAGQENYMCERPPAGELPAPE